MENSFQTSFIPKKPIISGATGKEPTNFFYLIAILLLVISVLLSAMLFVYKIYLNKQQESLSSSLAINSDSFEKETIAELELFSKRTASAKEVLENHVVLSPLFSLLGEITIPQIQYTRFEEQIDDKGVILVKISGVALDYRSIALQADVFSSKEWNSFKNVLFSNLIKNKNGNVSFELKFNVEPDVISYEKNSLNEEVNPLPEKLENVTQ